MVALRIVRQSGVIPYRFSGDTLEVLLVTNRSRSRWLVPKGHLEPCMLPVESALMEAYEEAGVLGMVEEHPIGSFAYFNGAVERRVELYPMRVTEVLGVWPEMTERSRQWTTADRAAGMVFQPDLQRCILELAGRFDYDSVSEAA